MESEFDEFFRKNCIRRSATVEQLASDLRRYLENSSIEERLKLKEWLESLSILNSTKPRFAARVILKVELEEQVGEDDFQKVCLPIEAMRNAIDAFERGELYLPQSVKELW